MAKLQLYIAKSLRGYKNLVNFNPTEDICRYVGDFRQALAGVEYDSSVINVFYLLSYREQGVLLTIIRTIPDLPGDHLAATVFVPKGLVMDPQALLGMVGRIRGYMCAPSMEAAVVGELRTLFSIDYPHQDVPARIDSEGRSYVCAFYGGNGQPALEDYAGAGFYIPAFARYAGVLLVDGRSGVTCKGEVVTPAGIPELIPLAPPAESREGFVPNIYHRAFNTPFFVPKGEPLEIVWKRGGFENVVQVVKPDSADFKISDPDTSGAVKNIGPGSFYITAQRSGEPLTDYTVRVNDCEIKSPVGFTFSELSSASVEIEAPGFFPFSGKLDLASTAQALVQMKELRKIYRFDLPVSTPEPVDSVHFTVQTKKKLSRCPVEGYAVAGDGLADGISHTNTLVYVGGHGRRNLLRIILMLLAGVVVGFVAGWYANGSDGSRSEAAETEITDFSGAETDDEAEEVVRTETAVIPARDTVATQSGTADAGQTHANQTAASQVSASAAATQDYSAAVAYLDSHRSWNRDEMEPLGLGGFFDAMNNYRFDEIKSVWASRLQGSSNFAHVLAAVEGSVTKRDPRTGNHQPAYNAPDDKAINWRGYTYWVDP